MRELRQHLFNESKLWLASAACLLVAFFLYFASGYERPAGVACIAAVALALATRLAHKQAPTTRWAMLLVGLLLVQLACDSLLQGIYQQHVHEWLLALALAVAAYGVLEGRRSLNTQDVLWLLLLPLVAHMGYFLEAIPHHLETRLDVNLLMRIEVIRQAAKIGPKHLGQVLILLIGIAYYLLVHQRRAAEGVVAVLAFFGACLSLSLIDSRGALVCLLVGAACALVVWRRMQRHPEAVLDEATSPPHHKYVYAIVLFCIIVAALMGWHRVKNVGEALVAAAQHEQYASWITPEHWQKEFCPQTDEPCSIDNSIYLRTSWIRFGLRVVQDHPLGIGPSSSPLSRALAMYYPNQVGDMAAYSDFHSGLMDVLVNYGIPGALLFALILAAPTGWVFWRAGHRASRELPLLAYITAAWATRLMVDGMNPYLWSEAWLYFGALYALMPKTPKATT